MNKDSISLAFYHTIKARVSSSLPTVQEPYKSILQCFFPEFIVALVLYTLIGIIDAQCVAHLKSTTGYAILGVTSLLTFFINKLAEGVSVGAVIMCGQYQGQKNHDMVGKAMMTVLWTTACVGGLIAAILYWHTELVYSCLKIPDSMAPEGIPFLRIRAIGVLFMFLFSALIGFLRGVKNTRAGMGCFVLGAFVFVFFDYALIFGKFGFPAYGLQGSALAFTLQYIVMFFAALIYIIRKTEYKVYNIAPLNVAWSLIKPIVTLSLPVTFDKAALQAERLWMVRLIAPMGSSALGSLNVIKDMEVCAFVPAVAFGQVATLLSSNNFGAKQFDTIKKITKIIIMLAAAMVGTIIGFFIMGSETIIGMFDRQHAFTDFAAQAFPVVGSLIFFDLLQLILAGALRGASNVQVVMWVRVISAVGVFMPLSYIIAQIPFATPVVKFIAIYGSFNVVNGLTSVVYMYWFRSGRWLK